MSTRRKKKVLKNLNKYKTIWHPESTLVYKSKKERLVIGRYIKDDDNLIPLDQETLDLCEEWNMKPDESLIEDVTTQNDEKEEEGEEGEEGEEEKGEEEEEKGEEEEEKGEEEEEGSESPVSSSEISLSNINQVVDQYNTYSKSFLSELVKWNKACESSHIEKLAAKQKEYDELKTKYDAIQKKFDTMKSLFA